MPALAVLILMLAGVGIAQQQGKDVPDLVLLFDNGASPDSERTMRFGLILPKVKDQTTPTGYKQLTWHPEGITSNTCVKIDGKEYLFGHPPGKWVEQEAKLGLDAQGKNRLGRKSIWLYPDQQVEVTQTVEIMAGSVTGKMDTCRVQYRVENQGQKERGVGLRFLLDTYIGSNDGAPFIVPFQKELCEKEMVFDDPAKIPPAVFALEKMKLNEPGVVAQLVLKTLEKMEPPVRVTLGGWPDERTKSPGAKSGLTLWNVPVLPIDRQDDSAAVLYWAEKKMKPGEKREVGFTYGLGLFSGEETGKLGFFVWGEPRIDGELVVLALVGDAKKGQTLSLKKSDAYEIIKGSAEQEVSLPGADSFRFSPATWQVRLKQKGPAVLRVESSTGVWHEQKLEIKGKS
jgi:hypothetical protein